jgi:Bacterial capsule synthesis protein PGA_cap
MNSRRATIWKPSGTLAFVLCVLTSGTTDAQAPRPVFPAAAWEKINPQELGWSSSKLEEARKYDWLRKWTHAEVDAGADIIVMHGAPLLHGVEIYHGRPIFYDLGNFIYNVPPVLTAIDEPMA